MHLSPTSTTFVPDVPVTPRTFADALLLPYVNSLGSFEGPNTAVELASRLLRLADIDGDGAVTAPEARAVTVRDEFTSPHRHPDATVTEQSYLVADVTFDAAVQVLAADADGDARVGATELAAHFARVAGVAPAAPFRSSFDVEGALAGARMLGVIARSEHAVRFPW